MAYCPHRRRENTTTFVTRIAAFFDLLTASGVFVIYFVFSFTLSGKYKNDPVVLVGWLFVGVCILLAPLLSGLLLFSTSPNQSAKLALVVASIWILHRTTCYVLLVIPVIKLRVLVGILGLSFYYCGTTVVIAGYICDLVKPRQQLKELVALMSLP